MAQKQKLRGRPIKNKTDRIPDTADNIARAIFRGADKKLLEKCAKEDYLLARTLARKQLLDDDGDLA